MIHPPTMAAVDLHVVDRRFVARALEQARLHGAPTREFNTAGLPRNAIRYSVPGLAHRAPPAWPVDFGVWQPLVAASQGLDPGYQFVLGAPCVERVVATAEAFAKTGRLPPAAAVEAIVERWPNKAELARQRGEIASGSSAPRQVLARAVFVQARPWDARVGACSMADAPQQGPVRSLRDLVERLCTSPKAAGALGWALDDDSGGSDGPLAVYLTPFNESLDPAYQYRVFCPPGNQGVSAISQYRWTQPWAELPGGGYGGLKKSGATINTTELTFHDRWRADRIYQGVQKIHEQILEFAAEVDAAKTQKQKTSWDDIPTLFHPTNTQLQALNKVEDTRSLRAALRRDGFTFDVLETPGGLDMQLVEVNAFGAMSKTPSCLFEWVRDADMLYGVQMSGPFSMSEASPLESVDFRVTR